jgi:hypothetical protein
MTGPELRPERGEALEEPAEELEIEEMGIRPVGEGRVRRRLLGVIMGQGQGVRSLDREDEIVRDALRVAAHDRRVGQAHPAGKKAPEPLIDLDRIQVLRVIGEIIIGPIGFCGS